jgi:hypothetical protein
MPISAYETLCTTLPCFAKMTVLVPSGLDTWWITCNNLFFVLFNTGYNLCDVGSSLLGKNLYASLISAWWPALHPT